jgi:hypothetical protein
VHFALIIIPMDLVQYIHPMEVGGLIFSWCILRWVEDLRKSF